MEADQIDFSDATQWRLSKTASSYVARGSGFIACIFQSKKPESSWGGWLKVDQPGDHEPLRLVWGDTLREIMLDLELTRRKQLDQSARVNTSEQANPTTPEQV
ncbi:hypothetical protein J8F10_19470 [Gemmata sp. G18]|uniref:Uncharacterized protein n=1 Tax=Gemmata palustris TaxID=2822762 RepID=A0ABS5BVJ7_9BACT|nr:hypothetical protein [Gemmata palustris]MBP3957432.1 hypothetical protein [Gemmata palustris]